MTYKPSLLAKASLGALIISGSLAAPAFAADDVIIVTARKKAESLQEVPVAVSVTTAADIAKLNLTDIGDISKTTAGMLFDNEFGRNSNRPVIRGQANILGESGVAYFIDGVYISNSIADYGLNNIERIEVVKGPQSALYGRNTYSGAINIITKSAGDTPEGNIRADISEHNRYDISGSYFMPISDTTSAHISARHYEFGGEHVNLFDGEKIGAEKSDSIAASLRTELGEMTLDLRGYYGQSRDDQAALFSQNASENNCFEDNGSLYAGLGRYFCGVVAPRPVNVNISEQAPGAGLDVDTLNLSAKLGYDFGNGWSFTSISGYNTRDEDFLSDADYQPTAFQQAIFASFPTNFTMGFPFGYSFINSNVDFTFSSIDETKDFSQEIRFNYDSDDFDIKIGGYYFDQSIESRDNREIPAGALAIAQANYDAALQASCDANPSCGFIDPNSFITSPRPTSLAESRDMTNRDIQNLAVFGAVSMALSPTVEFTVEGRYAEEKINREAFAYDEGDAIPDPVVAEAKFTSFDPRFTLDWNVTPSNLLYAVAATGKKPGGFNGTTAIQAGKPAFDEETVKSLEIGSKNTVWDGQATINIAAYTNEVEGYQLTQNVRVENTGNTASATVNAGDAQIKGVEVEFRASPDAFEGFTFTANYAYTDATFKRGTDETEGLLLDVSDDGLRNDSIGCEVYENPNDLTSDCLISRFGDITGKRIPRTAEHMLFVDADYRGEINSDWDFNLGASYAYESSKFGQVQNYAETGTANLLSARIGVSNDRYSFQIYGKNLLDEDSTPLVLRYADGADSFKRSFVGSLRRGSHFGANLGVKF